MTDRPPLTAAVLDADGQHQGRLNYERAGAVLRWRQPGSWSITVDDLNDAAWALTKPGASIVLRDPDTGGTVVSGPMTLPRLLADENTPGRIVAHGETDEVHLRDRLAYPVPASPPNNQAADSHDRRSGPASTVLLAYVNANAGPGARPERRVPGLTLATDPGVGDYVIGAARFPNLLDLLEELAVAGGDVGFDVRRTLTTGPVFRVYRPRDLTRAGRFALVLGNVTDLDWALAAPKATVVIGGGQGDLEARTFVAAEDQAAADRWHRRIETFHDARAEGDPAKLQQDVETKLAEAGETAQAKISPRDGPNLRYGIDYGLGDRITVEAAPARTVTGVIREVEITVTPDGTRYEPRVGDPGATVTDAGTVALAGAQRDLRALQTGK